MSGLEVYKQANKSPVLSKKIKDLQRPEIGLIVKYICAVTGISKIPEGFESKVLIDFILNQFQNYGILEFKTAFDMYVNGKLPKRDNESHYNTISAAFIGSVMNKYNTQRIIEMRKLDEEKEKLTTKPVYTAETYANAFNYVRRYIAQHNTLPAAGQYVHAYEHFKATGLGWYRLDLKERIGAKKEFQDKVRSQLTGEAREYSARGNLSQRALKDANLFKTECKLRYAKEQMSKLIKDEQTD